MQSKTRFKWKKANKQQSTQIPKYNVLFGKNERNPYIATALQYSQTISYLGKLGNAGIQLLLLPCFSQIKNYAGKIVQVLSLLGLLQFSQINVCSWENDARLVGIMQKAPGIGLAAYPDANAHSTTKERTEGIISIHWCAPAVKGGYRP